MKSFKVLVVEDELIVAMNLCDQLDTFGYETLTSVTNYEDAIESIKTDTPDIAILDINLVGSKSGIDIAQFIDENCDIPFIFLTSFNDSQTFDQAKLLNPSAYLVKPFNGDDLYRSIELALNSFHPALKTETEQSKPDLSAKDAFIIRMNNNFKKIYFTDIAFIKSDHVYVNLHTKNGSNHLIRSTMSGLMECLPNNFMQVHRSNIINLDFVEKAENNSIIINSEIIPIGRSYSKNLKNKLNLL